MYDQELPEWSEELGQELLATLPLFVSIPRSGCNWLQAVMELYFNRHRAFKGENTPTWLESKYENPMWMHTHDNFNHENISTNKPAIFLWRDPVDTIYSLAKLQKNENNPSAILGWCGRFARCYKKWAIDQKNVLVVKYENVLEHPMQEMKRISEWHGVEFNEAQARRALEIVGDKRSVNEKNGTNKAFKNQDSHTKPYEQERERFRDVYGSMIKETVSKVLADLG